LPLVLIDSDARSVIRLEGEVDIASADELKAMIATAIASRKEICLDLEQTTDLDVTAVQLLCCAAREAEKTGSSLEVAHLPESIGHRVREMGLDEFPARAKKCP
jgi:anti-anti-sigma factor